MKIKAVMTVERIIEIKPDWYPDGLPTIAELQTEWNSHIIDQPLDFLDNERSVVSATITEVPE